MTATLFRDRNAMDVPPSGIGRAVFPWEARGVKSLQLPMVGPKKSDIGFWPGARQLSSVYMNDSGEKTLAN